MNICRHIIDEATYKPSPNHSGVIVPRLVVIHYTADNSLSGALSWLCSRQSNVSAHLIIGKRGELYQLVPFNLKAWHAGISSWKGKRYVNGYSIGIENVGKGDEWPEPQIDKLLEVLDAIIENYDIEDIVGHDQVAPGRKFDPGPRFPWHLIQERYTN